MRFLETRRSAQVLRAVIIGAALVSRCALCQAADVTLSANVVGATPERIGYNSGHFMPGSNTAAWWKYSGVNAARVWSTPSVVENNPAVSGNREDDNTLYGDGVTTRQQFLDRRAALRTNQIADPNLSSSNYINWPLIKDNYQNTATSSNKLTLNHAFGSLKSLGIEPVVEMDRTNSRYPFNPLPADPTTPSAGWGERWEQWQHFYAQAFYLAKNFDIHRFQMYNEPNHFSSPDTAPDVTPQVYLERLQFASDAVQAAVADVNVLYGKNLDPQMQGPITAGGANTYSAWGAPIMQNLQHNFLGQGTIKLIDTYGYQQYNDTGAEFAAEMVSIKNSVNAAAGGSPMRFAITEFNTQTAGSMDTPSENLDNPQWFSRLGSIVSNLTNARPDELYIQKFSQTDGKLNGVHFVDDGNSPYNVGGVTKGGEVVRLFAKGFAGSQELFAKPTATGAASGLDLAASYNPDQGRFALMSANESGQRSFQVDLAAWGIEPGTFVTVEEVSSDRHGEVSALIEVPANGVISVQQPAQSVLLLTAPDVKPAYRVTLGATDDAMVKSGANASSNYGASANLFSKNDAVDASARNVSFIKFDMGDVDPDAVEQAVLRVHGENDGSAATVLTHVYGLLGDNWNEESIDWINAPNLKDSLGAVNDISHNFIEGIGVTADVVGHFTGTQTARELMLDVTPFVRAHPDEQITFLVAREVRMDGENVDDALTSLRLDSKESGVDAGPQLILSLNATALPADFNGDGEVDGEDLDAWKTGVGMNGNAQRSNGDADGDGDVDGGDFLAWQQALGSQLIPSATAAAAAVPEPCGAALSAWVGWCLLISRRLL